MGGQRVRPVPGPAYRDELPLVDEVLEHEPCLEGIDTEEFADVGVGQRLPGGSPERDGLIEGPDKVIIVAVARRGRVSSSDVRELTRTDSAALPASSTTSPN